MPPCDETFAEAEADAAEERGLADEGPYAGEGELEPQQSTADDIPFDPSEPPPDYEDDTAPRVTDPCYSPPTAASSTPNGSVTWICYPDLLPKLIAETRPPGASYEKGVWRLAQRLRRIREQWSDAELIKVALEWYRHHDAGRFGVLPEECSEALIRAVRNRVLRPDEKISQALEQADGYPFPRQTHNLPPLTKKVGRAFAYLQSRAPDRNVYIACGTLAKRYGRTSKSAAAAIATARRTGHFIAVVVAERRLPYPPGNKQPRLAGAANRQSLDTNPAAPIAPAGESLALAGEGLAVRRNWARMARLE